MKIEKQLSRRGFVAASAALAAGAMVSAEPAHAATKLADVGWVWEGQGLDPGVYPSIFGVGEGAEFFGLRRAHYLFHPNTDLALQKLSPLEEVRCDISKWKFRNCGTTGGGSECYNDSTLEEICAEAEKVSRFSLTYKNISGGFFDDMKGLMEQRGHTPEECAAVRDALKRHNPSLQLECVVYAHELEKTKFWKPLAPLMDVISFWVWGYQHLETLEDSLHQCIELFPGKPILMGCYLRDYPTAAPIPLEAIKRQWNTMAKALADKRIVGYDILGAVLIDGQLEQATWVRDFIKANS